MPSKFAEFELPKGASALRTDKEGYAAMEQAGRRVGQLYGQAGSDYAAIGRLEDEAFRAQDFPLDFAAFRSGSTRGSGGGGGTNFRVSNPGSGFGGTTDGGGSGGRSTGAFPRSRATASQRDDTVRSAAQLVDGWGRDISKEAGGPSILNRGGNPTDVGQGSLTNPFSSDYRPGGERQSNWNYAPGAVQYSPLDGDYAGSPPAPGYYTPGGYTQGGEYITPTSSAMQGDIGDKGYAPAPPESSAIRQYFNDIQNSVTAAVSSVGAASVDSSTPDIGSY